MAKSNPARTKAAPAPAPRAERKPVVPAPRSTPHHAIQMPFDRLNYIYLLICIGLIIGGYAIMRLENQAEGMLSLFVSPILLLAGYLGIFYAIMKRPKRENKTPDAG